MVARDVTLRKRWPEHLIERVASRNFVLVLGAGTSRGCENGEGDEPEDWESLLLKLAADFAGSSKAKARTLIFSGDYLEAAEMVRTLARKSGKEHDFLRKIVRLTDGAPNVAFKPRELHSTLLRLEPDVLLTTNYDKILERATGNGYQVHRYDSTTLADDVRSGTPVLVKIHGSVDSSSEMILTRSDYSRLRVDGARAMEVVQALLLTRTALFFGYSFSDPDMRLMLENVLGAREGVAAHYLVTSKSIPEYVEQVYRYSYGTSVIKFTDGDYAELERMMELLADEVEGLRTPAA